VLHLCSGEPAQEVSVGLLLLITVGAKILKPEEVISGQLEVERRTLAEAMEVTQHVLTRFRSRPPKSPRS
jgi:predicted regulator of amino acid metabolism with ACT domain